MPTTAVSARSCPKCGADIPRERGDGLCAACLFESALNADPNEPGTSSVLMDFGNYELLEELGRGGQGVVYRARQKGLNRIVALKVIGLGHWATEAHLRRFRMEAEAAAQLDHPCIVPIYEIGEHDGACFFSMKLVDGGQLDQLVRQNPPAPRSSAELMANVARTVHYAHEHGVLHRDLKPGNILIDRNGEPHLTDFGLARLVERESNVTRTVDVLGTPSYMAPEQASGGKDRLTSATDVYGLGAVFYHLLTGQPPFAGGTTYETIRLVMETEPRAPRLWNTKVDRDLSTICLKCLEKDPARRYASALALAEDLERWLRHEPIVARHTGLMRRGGKWVRRNPVLAIALPLCVALASAAGFSFWRSVRDQPLPAAIAVLPFENLSDDKDTAFVADGLQDDILTKLAKVADLKVISRTSVMDYRGERNTRKIGAALRVSHVLEGSVRQSNGRLHVNAQLIDTRNDTHVWAESYDRAQSELFSMESILAQAVAARLSAKLSPAEKSALQAQPTGDLAAYELYSRGRQLLQRYSILDPDILGRHTAAVGLLEQAIARDPNFALGWAALAEADLWVYWESNKSPEWLRKAEAALQHAQQLAPDAGETHLAQALLFYRKLDYGHALEELDTTARLLPNSAEVFQISSWVERRLGHWREALRHCARAVELNPRDIAQREDLIRDHTFVRQFADAAQLAEAAVAEFPEEAEHFRLLKGGALLALGDLPGARAALESCSPAAPYVVQKFLLEFYLLLYERNFDEARRLISKRSQLAEHASLSPDVCFEGWVAQAEKNAAAMQTAFTACHEQLERQLHERGEGSISASNLALADAALGHKEEALREEERALAIADPLERSSIVFDLASVWLSLGENERALAELESVVKSACGASYGELRFNPIWDSLRDNPRFKKVLEEVGQPLHF